jgi:alginate O-acetyltransferase complex protein AlgI
MLFNSFAFIFAFLPVALIGFYILRSLGRMWSMWFLSLASFGFYAWWLPRQSWILVASILFNYAAGHFIQKYRTTNAALARLILIGGLCADLGTLFYFKYTVFVLANLKLMLGSDFVVPHILLPLGISFFTFQKIAYLVDCSRGEAKNTSFSEFCLFASFFPQLIAGPIVHHKEIIPQFRDKIFGRLQWSNILVGLTIFSIGLVKKTVFADSISTYFGPMYKAAAAGNAVDVRTGWLIAVSWTLQVYFDFSGYSDMAIGLGRMFGVRLPLNFHSPLRAASVIDYWRRWHMSLQRFIVAYVFHPMALPLNRFAVRRKLKGWPAYCLAVVTPSFITFFLLGIWHGAGWGYVVYGLLNGAYVSVNEAFRELKRRRKKALQRAGKLVPPETVLARVGSHVITLACVFTGNMFFRAESLRDGVAIFRGMWGFNGAALNPSLSRFYDPAFLALLAAGGIIIVFLPNTQQIMSNYRPAANWRLWKGVGRAALAWSWRPALIGLSFVSMALFLGAEFIQRGAATFVYFNF